MAQTFVAHQVSELLFRTVHGVLCQVKVVVVVVEREIVMVVVDV